MTRASSMVGGLAQGFPFRRVLVESVGGGQAQVIDQYGAHLSMPTSPRRGGGPLPREGETWVIDRALGTWTFAALAVGQPPVVTGSTDGVPALRDLLVGLDAAGLISNKSTTLPVSTFDATWQAVPVYLSGWTGTVTFRKHLGGLVLLRGSLTPPPPVVPAVPLAPWAFTLPVGYRPSATLSLLGVAGSSAGVLSITATGRVSLSAALTVDPVSFLAEP